MVVADLRFPYAVNKSFASTHPILQPDTSRKFPGDCESLCCGGMQNDTTAVESTALAYVYIDGMEVKLWIRDIACVATNDNAGPEPPQQEARYVRIAVRRPRCAERLAQARRSWWRRCRVRYSSWLRLFLEINWQQRFTCNAN